MYLCMYLSIYLSIYLLHFSFCLPLFLSNILYNYMRLVRSPPIRHLMRVMRVIRSARTCGVHSCTALRNAALSNSETVIAMDSLRGSLPSPPRIGAVASAFACSRRASAEAGVGHISAMCVRVFSVCCKSVGVGETFAKGEGEAPT
jgi:hypothetical protein